MDWMTGDLTVVDAPIEEIKPYINNPRINNESVPAVAASIRAYGFQQPIVVDRYMTIIAGHTRYKAAKLLKLETVPVVIADDLTPEQARAYRLADNRTAELALWDAEKLSEELKALTEEGYAFPYDYGFAETVNIDEDFAAEFTVPDAVLNDHASVESSSGGESAGDGAVICPRCGYEFEGEGA